jgi:hypothetical protein
MHDEALARIDAAIAALQNVEPDKAPLAESIIARLMAARRGLCESRELYAASSTAANDRGRADQVAADSVAYSPATT